MSSDVEFKVDAEEVLDAFKRLNSKNMNKVHKRALRDAAKIIQKQARKNFRQLLKKSSHKGGVYYKHGQKRQYSDSLGAGVRIIVWKNGEVAKVHVLGTRKTGSGTFRAKFFEKGTRDRKTKKGLDRGAIQPPLRYLKKAEASKGNEALESIDNYIAKETYKIYNK